MSAPEHTEAEERFEAALAGLSYQKRTAADGMATLDVAADDLLELLGRLKDRGGFETNTLVTAVDRYPDEPRFQLVYQFLSVAHADRIRVHVDVGGDDPRVPTITHLWPGAAYAERETWDMFGIRFDGHEGLKRLLMPDGYDHHPLRKDFPHQGIEPDRLYREWDKKRRETPAGER